MGTFSKDLRLLGYEPTGEESPFDEDGELWTNSFELVCDETAIVIRKGERGRNGDSPPEKEYRYRNSGKPKLYGGFLSSYDWGDDDGRFAYDLNSSQ